MLRRKYTVQKSIRFDEKLADDLGYLAEQTERTQNDLVNIAVENLLTENKSYFIRLAFVDNLFDFFENGAETESCEIGGIHVTVRSEDESPYYRIQVTFKDEEGNVIESFEHSSDDIDEIKNELMDYAEYHLYPDDKDVQEYLKHRLDYK